MAGEEDTPRHLGELTEEQAGRMLADMNEVIRAGEEMRKLRAEMIKLFVGLGWTQDRIARLAGMSQPAVSKQVAKAGADEPPPMTELSLDQGDVPWLEGRLWGLAEEISEAFPDTARCTRCVSALARGRKRFTPRHVDELRRLVEEDLGAHREQLPAGYREAYDRISRGLDVPAEVTATASASVRRTLAHRLQRDRLGAAAGPPAPGRAPHED
ncbi:MULTISPECIES: sigma-70 family RNA polymerase sigma factor [unclassified Streptomyces]|uniref:sigma-70 family RNA polymerase sigma factor n=1 Tax=unclassified Streptomyces TaxID=2593676 RepID=UPI0011E70047|nr:sigma-70 family RNA polymerase sigma factor [Streptomyces sp. sk2.1]TXS75526.1 sigma-70 family RNA polymerase sigma factor [Streptomyces sp. sk2.1]